MVSSCVVFILFPVVQKVEKSTKKRRSCNRNKVARSCGPWCMYFYAYHMAVHHITSPTNEYYFKRSKVKVTAYVSLFSAFSCQCFQTSVNLIQITNRRIISAIIPVVCSSRMRATEITIFWRSRDLNINVVNIIIFIPCVSRISKDLDKIDRKTERSGHYSGQSS